MQRVCCRGGGRNDFEESEKKYYMIESSGNNMEINHRLDKIEQTLERLEAVLTGDKYNPVGYVGRLDNVEKRIEKLEDARREEKWLATTFKIASGAIVGAAAVKILEQIIK